MMRALTLFAATLLLAIAATPAAAQLNTGTVTGVVRDEQGLALPGANVDLINEETGASRPVASAENGAFTIPAVPQGRYTLRVTLDGFRTVERRGIQLTSNETFNAGSVTLTVGQFSEVTRVTAEVSVVQTGSSEISTVLEAKQMDSLISRGRDPLSLLRTLPGVATSGDGPTSLGSTNGTAMPNISGMRSNVAGITLDGMAANDVDTNNNVSTIGVDAIEEIKVINNNYQAEYGRSAGASVNIISKSGGRDFRGTLAYYVRHDGLNANNFFNNRAGIPKPLYRYNTVSGTLGGPVFIPRVLEGLRDRMFFFYAREDWRTREPRALRQITTPTPRQRQGDFSQTYDLNGRQIPIIDPLTRLPFPNNTIPAERINQYGQALLNLFPLPNSDASVSRGNYNYQDQDIAKTQKTMNQFKLDYNATTMDRLSFRARNWDPLTEAYSGIYAVDSNWNQLYHSYSKGEKSFQVNHTHTFGASMVNELSISARRTREAGPSIADNLDTVIRDDQDLGGLGQLYPVANPLGVVPQLTFGGVPSAPTVAYDSRFPISAGDKRYAIANNFSWTTARHLVKAGIYWEHDYNSEGLSANCYGGCLDFTSDTNNPNDTGYAFANALLGNFRSYSESTTRVFRGGENNILEWFIQDSWKPRANLTLEIGARFSSALPWKLAKGQVGGAFVQNRFVAANEPRLFTPTVVNGQRMGIDRTTGQTVPAALIGFMVPGSGDFFNGIVNQDDPMADNGWRDTPPIQVQPRLGFAWDPRGDGKTAVRGGFGVTKQSLFASGSFANSVSQGPPARLQPSVFYANLSSLGSAVGYLSPFDTVFGYQADYVPETYYNWSLNVQRNIGHGTVVSVAYIGNRGRHLGQSRNINVVPPGARFDSANADPTNPSRPLSDVFLTPITGYGSITIYENTGISDYHALQVTANRRFSQGLQYGFAYTWSRARNLTDAVGALPLYRDPKAYLFGVAGYDQTHVLNVNYVWDIPSGSRLWSNHVTRALLDNWQVAGITLFATGRPSGITFTTTDSADITGGGDPGRLDVTGDPTLSRGDRTFTRWFDTSVFARPARGDAGNARRQVIRLPGLVNWDLTLSKMLAGRAGRGLQFRAELYNAFNQVHGTGVDTTARFDPQGHQVNARFGQVIAAGDPRVIQLSLRAMF